MEEERKKRKRKKIRRKKSKLVCAEARVEPTSKNPKLSKEEQANVAAHVVKLKQGSIACGQSLPGKKSRTSTQKPSFREKLQNKLESGRFRWINEKLYTSNSVCALKMFKAEPELFDVYHQGFSSQVQKWPVNPVDTMIKWIIGRSPQLIIADMGCGEAKISQCVPNKVFSFDLVAVNDFVTACDMAKGTKIKYRFLLGKEADFASLQLLEIHVSLADESVDIVIYCLSLMGTNLNDFLQEAHRILKSNGLLKIAEVVSRFESLSSFEDIVCSLGFTLLNKDTSNKMFVQFEFKKLSKQPDQMKTLPLSLKPCLYRRR